MWQFIALIVAGFFDLLFHDATIALKLELLAVEAH